MKSKKLKSLMFVGLGTLALTPTIAVAVSCSGNKQNEEINESSLPETPLKPDTSKITTFAEAIKFTNEFLSKNYNLAMFKKSIDKWITREVESMKRYGTLTCSATFKKSSNKNQLDIDTIYKLDGQSPSGTKMSQTISCSWKNVSIIPVLLKVGNQIKVKLFGSFSIWTNLGSRESQDPNVMQPDWVYTNFEQLKQNNPNYSTKNYANVLLESDGHQQLDNYVINKSDLSLIQKNIWTEQTFSMGLFGLNTISQIYDLDLCDISFDNLSDIEQNLKK